MNTYFSIAAGLSLFNTGLHLFLGGKQIARPLLKAESLGTEVRAVLYYCWHLATLGLALQAILFAIASIYPAEISLAVVATGFAASFAILGILTAPAIGVSYKVLPQGWLFVPVTIVGLAGLLL